MIWKLSNLLDELEVTGLQVEREAIKLGFEFGKNTIYRLLKDDGPKLVDRRSLAAVIAALRSLSGKEIEVEHIIEYAE